MFWNSNMKNSEKTLLSEEGEVQVVKLFFIFLIIS